MARPITKERTPADLAQDARKKVSSALSGLKRFDTNELAQMEALEGMETVIGWLRELEWCLTDDAPEA